MEAILWTIGIVAYLAMGLISATSIALIALKKHEELDHLGDIRKLSPANNWVIALTIILWPVLLTVTLLQLIVRQAAMKAYLDKD